MYKSQDIDKFMEYVNSVDANLHEVVYLLYCSYNPQKKIQRRCEHVFQKGNRVGQSCNILIDVQNSAFCKQHRKTKIVQDTFNIDINSVLSDEEEVVDHISELESDCDQPEVDQTLEDESIKSTTETETDAEEWFSDEDEYDAVDDE